MSGEKKHWRLPTPFRRFSGKQDLQQKSEVEHPRSRVSSVYLSDDTSANGFIVVPEFDDAARTQQVETRWHEEFDHASQLPKLPAVTFFNQLSPDGVDSYRHDLEPIGFHYHSYPGGGSCNTSVANTSWHDDLSQRLSSAYEHIHSMPSAASPRILLSSDPQMLRKQLGVPQHSVLNYPIHSSPDLPNPHTPPREATSPKLPSTASPDASHAKTSKKLGLCINTNVYPNSPRSGFSDPFQPAQRKSVAVPALTENPPSQCRTLEVPWSACITCTPKPQPSISNPSKLVKRRVERSIIPPSFLPSSRRQPLKGVLRKPAADTLPSTNAHRWQISLPQIRSPSPFKVDIVSLFAIRHSTCNAVTSSSPFIIRGATVKPILTLPPSVIPR
ncbi:hypothetical protein OG21DRAFT_1502469 [Imleria badia]|nr:hypothetical protein OG21DRAFT_1502469 [Imleria badia]